MLKSVRERHGVRQVPIMEAVTRLITTRGLESVTIRDIAQLVGLTEGAVYRHFVSKQQILLYLIYQVGEFLLGSVREQVVEENSALENLERIFRAQVRDIEDNWGLALIVVAGAVVLDRCRPAASSELHHGSISKPHQDPSSGRNRRCDISPRAGCRRGRVHLLRLRSKLGRPVDLGRGQPASPTGRSCMGYLQKGHCTDCLSSSPLFIAYGGVAHNTQKQALANVRP